MLLRVAELRSGDITNCRTNELNSTNRRRHAFNLNNVSFGEHAKKRWEILISVLASLFFYGQLEC